MGEREGEWGREKGSGGERRGVGEREGEWGREKGSGGERRGEWERKGRKLESETWSVTIVS